MTIQQIKAYVTLSQLDQITRFDSASAEQIARTYQITEQLGTTVINLLKAVSSRKGAWIVLGERGVGKSHLLGLIRSLSQQPDLASLLPTEVNGKFWAREIPFSSLSNLATLTINFDPEAKSISLKILPENLQTFLNLLEHPATTPAQLSTLITKITLNSQLPLAIFIDGISSILTMEEKWVAWLEQLSLQASKQFALFVALDEELLHNEVLAEKLLSSFHLEHIDLISLVDIVDQYVFRKIPAQRQAIQYLYVELCQRMPYFRSSAQQFTRCYPLHPVTLELLPAMRRYARSFSLFAFITSVGARALVRRGLNLISADDLFESFEFDLRKNSQLTDTFIAYDYLFNRVIPTLGQPDTLYAKMMLRALLLLSLAKLPATILDLASAVMLYDEREPQGFIQRLTNIMQQLRQNHPAIVAEESEAGPCYYFQTVPLNSNDPLPIRDTTPSTTLTPSVQEAFISQAATINDQDPRLADLLITYGRKYFQDWPFYQDANGKLHDRAEINLKWRGSLRRGIIKWGGDYEAKLNTGIKQSEYDWQIILLPPINAKPPSVLPDSSTLLYWHPHILSDSETSIFKYLLILQQQGTTLFSNPAELAKIVQPLEARAEEIFTRIYLDEGHFFSGRGKTLPAKATSTLLNIFLTTKLNDGLSQLYPLHPQFEELLLPDYINDLASWMFASDRLPTLQQQLYLEKFARPLELIIGSGNNYQLNTQFLPNSPAGRLLQLITSASSPVSKLQAYALLRNEPLGLQLPALLLLLAALAASGKVTLAKDTGEPLHGPKGLYANCELSDFGWIYSAHSSPLPLSVPPPPPAAPMPAVVSKTNYIYTVLIVSPQASILQQLTEACGDLGCRLELVATGQEALQKMDATTSLVIADLQLPDTDAVDLFKQLQTNPLQRDIPFIVLTEVNQGDELARVLESGIEDFWLKPLQIPEIKIRLKRVLRRNLTRTSAYAAIAWPVSHLANSNTPTTGSPMLSTSLPSNASLPLLPDLLVSPPIIPEKVLETPHITSPAISSAPIRFTTTMEVNPSNLPFIDVEPESLAEAQLINAELISAELSPIAFDRLAIPSVMAETQSTNDAAPLFPNFTVEEEISPRRAVPNIEIPQFTISITSSETDSLPILQLYNQFWDTCRRVGNPKTIPEYEEFCQLIATHLKQWPAPVLIDEGIIFSVDVENNQAYVNYYLHNNVDKLNPKQFRLL